MVSDVSPGEGWWVASDGRWYPPPSDTPPSLEPLSEARRADGAWQAKNGRWYPSHLYPEYTPAPPSEALTASGDSADEESVERTAIAVAAAQHCANGHEMAEPQAFCSVCGSKRIDETTASVSVDPQAVTGTCANGHPMDGSHAFCSVCGGARKTAPVKIEAGGHSTDMPSSPSGLAPYTRVSILIVVGVLAAIILVVILLAGVGGGKSQSYQDGWNTGVDPTQNVACNDVTAPSGDDQAQWVQGCNDGTNAYNNAVNSYDTPPTTYPGGNG